MTKETVCIRLDPEIWRNAKIMAAKKSLKLGELVEDALKAKINKKE